VLSDAKCKQKAAGGKPNTLSVENQLLMVLEYWREYRTYFHIGQAYGISESAAYRNIKWCENTLAKSKSFRLPGRKAVAASDLDVVLIDATETPIERPKKQRRYYLGKKKRHTLKTQLVVEKSTRRILCIAHEKGRRHDFRLFKRSKVRLLPETKAVVDSGYQGLQRVHANTAMRRRPVRRDDGAAGPQAASGGHRGQQGSNRRCLQGRSPDAVAFRFRQNRRRPRRP
jgi:hypothetical protein